MQDCKGSEAAISNDRFFLEVHVREKQGFCLATWKEGPSKKPGYLTVYWFVIAEN